MNDLIRPALYGAKHQIYPLLKNSSTIKNTEFVGPVCESSDTFISYNKYQKLNEGITFVLIILERMEDL